MIWKSKYATATVSILPRSQYSPEGLTLSSRLNKALGGGNKLENIPELLVSYTGFIKSDASVKWIGWQLKGKEFLEIDSNCPYCASSIEGKKETSQQCSNLDCA